MPIFEYQCQACGHRFDALQSPGMAALRKCPECGKLRLRKALSTPSFHLRGSGWRKGAAADRKAPGARQRRVGHTLDSGAPHSHEDHHDHGQRGHAHSHGGHSHSHRPGHRHGHKH